MPADRPAAERPATFEKVLGYLNFSSGTPDPQFLACLNDLYASIETGELRPSAAGAASDAVEPTCRTLGRILAEQLEQLAGRSPAFSNVEQGRAVLRLVFDEFPPRYRAFHQDLLFHQTDEAIWGPFFLGRVCEAILAQGPAWNESDRIVSGAIARLNDYIGHRPVAVLRTAQRIEPYAHEWIRPVPLYVAGAGVSVSPYRQIVERALEILRTTDPSLLREAQFDPSLLDELSFDPRAYDFDHPVNKRPNYHFGQWDPHAIDNQGRYRRFVVQQVTLDVLLDRVEHPGELSPDELTWEAAAVLAGTMLMASGTSGSGPDAHDSSTTLGTLLPRIAAYRDAFYEAFIAGQTGVHGERLRAEAAAGKQPLAGARQHLNQQLARRRASQLEHVHLALLFAQMGYPAAALRQAQIVPVASSRMVAEIQCRLSTGHRAIDERRLGDAAQALAEIEEFLRRAIECGALVDPWNMLGFQGQFSLFPAPENSVPDHRVDLLVELLEQTMGLYARLWSDAARDEQSLEDALSQRMKALAEWWDQFAPTSIESIEGFSGLEAFESAREVAATLTAFHHAGAAAGDIAFWRQRVSHFNSAKAYALVVGALLDRPDLLAAMALIMQWLSQVGMIPLRQGEYSFHVLVRRWLAEVCVGRDDEQPMATDERRALVCRFFELLEANAEDFWQVPDLDLLGTGVASGMLLDEDDEEDLEEDDEEETDDGLYSAAYDEMVYIDSTGDGVDADMLESGGPAATDFELEGEARRVGERLALLRTVATLWKQATLFFGPLSASPLPREVLAGWLAQAEQNRRGLVELLGTIDARPIPQPSSTRDSLLEFDRRRGLKESLMEKVGAAVVDTADAVRSMRAALPAADDAGDSPIDDVLRSVVRGDADGARRHWPRLLEDLQARPILYVPLGKGGDPARLADVRALEQALRDLVEWLPRLGMIAETCQLLEAARLMEATNPVGPGAISEYDRLFGAGYEAIVETLVDVSADWPATDAEPDKPDSDLIECLELVTESLLKQWLAHSRTLRLSVLERITDEKSWQALVNFVTRYGRDLFTQRFLHLGNLRAILHQGVERWLAGLEEQPEPGEAALLVDDLGGKLSRADAVKHMSLVIEAVAENYAEYRDYNSTTTQSDRGDLIFTLLDFLRLRVHYDRVAWHLKPVLAAHSILVRRGRNAAAEAWRRALAERTAELADTLQARCAELREKYAMRLPTVADRIGERFIRPLAIDRVRALVKPAMAEARSLPANTGAASERAGAGGAAAGPSSFELLEQETDELAHEPTGVGLDVPGWLVALEQEVEHERRARSLVDRGAEHRPPLAQSPLTMEEVQRQLTGWERHPH